MALVRLFYFVLILHTSILAARPDGRGRQRRNESDGREPASSNSTETLPRISSGEDAPIGRFPYMCSLKRTRGEEHICGGTLIRRQWVLTAAHCVDPNQSLADHSPLVHVGSYLLNDPDAEERAADMTIIHCNWNGNVLDGNDIALIKLNRPSSNQYLRLPSRDSESFEGELYSTLGWGNTGQGEGFSEVLQQLDNMMYVSQRACNSFELYRESIDNRMLCALSPTGDTCAGDSGGPLLEINSYSNIEEGNPELDLLVGITSHGPATCEAQDGPGVYTRVAEYRDWIDRVIQSDGEWNCGTSIRDEDENEDEMSPEEEETDTVGRMAGCAGNASRDSIDQSVIAVNHMSGVFSSRPSCLNIREGRIDCYIRSMNSDMVHIAKEDNMLIVWEDMGLQIVDAPECISLSSGHMDCFALGVEGPSLWNRFWYENRGFSEWRNRGGRFLETPSCFTRYGSQIACFLRNVRNTPMMIEYTRETGWKDYERLNGTMLAPFACGSRGSDFIDCLGAGNDFEIHHNSYREGDGFSSDWMPLGVRSRLRPTILHPDSNTVEAFVVTIEGNMAHASFNGRRWGDWETIEGFVASEPECIACSETTFHCFAVGTNGTLMHNFYDGSLWSPWKATAEKFQDRPSCVKFSDTEIRCYSRDDESSLTEIIYEIPIRPDDEISC